MLIQTVLLALVEKSDKLVALNKYVSHSDNWGFCHINQNLRWMQSHLQQASHFLPPPILVLPNFVVLRLHLEF